MQKHTYRMPASSKSKTSRTRRLIDSRVVPTTNNHTKLRDKLSAALKEVTTAAVSRTLYSACNMSLDAHVSCKHSDVFDAFVDIDSNLSTKFGVHARVKGGLLYHIYTRRFQECLADLYRSLKGTHDYIEHGEQLMWLTKCFGASDFDCTVMLPTSMCATRSVKHIGRLVCDRLITHAISMSNNNRLLDDLTDSLHHSEADALRAVRNAGLPDATSVALLQRTRTNIELLPEDEGRQTRISTYGRRKLPFYVTDNMDVRFDDPVITSFRLLRIKCHVEAIIQINGKSPIKLFAPGEVIDVTIPHAGDHKRCIHFANNESSMYRSVPIKTSRAKALLHAIYPMKYAIHELRYILWELTDDCPSVDSKYIKRLDRYLTLERFQTLLGQGIYPAHPVIRCHVGTAENNRITDNIQHSRDYIANLFPSIDGTLSNTQKRAFDRLVQLWNGDS